MAYKMSIQGLILIFLTVIALKGSSQEDKRYKKFKEKNVSENVQNDSIDQNNHMHSRSSGGKKIYFHSTDFLNEAGKELIVASNHFYTGFGLTFAGAGFSTIGIILKDKEDYESYISTSLIIGGSVMSLVGVIFTIESFYHIKKAGIHLRKTENYALSIQPTREGLGIVMRL